MGRLVGLEPTSAGATIQCVNQLHHSRHVLNNNILNQYIMQEKNDRKGIINFMDRYLTVKIGDQERKVKVIRSKRKTVSLIIKEEGKIEIRCGLYTDEAFILDFIEEKKEWIAEAVSKQINRDSLISTGSNGSYAYWLGKKYSVSLKKGSKNMMLFNNDCIQFTLKEISQKEIDSLFYKEAGKKLAEMITKRRNKLDRNICLANKYPVPRITLKYMTSRWGSCTPSRSHISLSLRLIHFPPECLEYVMVHEYCHFLVGNHSKDFYREVEKLMPDYRKALAKLK